MTQNEVNKILTEKVAKKPWYENGTDINITYSVWGHYGPLLEKIIHEIWYDQFIAEMKTGIEYHSNPLTHFMFWSKTLLNPTRGSLTLAEFVVAHNEIFGGK